MKVPVPGRFAYKNVAFWGTADLFEKEAALSDSGLVLVIYDCPGEREVPTALL